MISRIIAWFNSRRARRVDEADVLVSADDDGVTVVYPQGDRESIRWSRLQRIEIHTNDSGPWGADVWWVLFGADLVCRFPQGATGDADVINALQSRDGFDHLAMLSAMGSVDNAQFVCWQRSDNADSCADICSDTASDDGADLNHPPTKDD